MSDAPTALRPDEVAALLRATNAAITAELTALPAAGASWHPAAGEWCVKETLGHMIETERRGFAGRIRIILDGDDPVLVGWDPDTVARERGDCARNLSTLLDEFSQQRLESARLVAGLSEADLQRGGQHPDVGYLRVVDLLHEWVHHDRNHLRQMLAAVQDYAWPHMGNAQRFSQP